MSERWVVSACLLGRPCRYDGRSKGHDGVRAEVEAARARGVIIAPVCPEAGLGTPRPAAELCSGDGHAVLDGAATVRRVADGADVTAAFVEGARACATGRIDRAILKANSPSCGVGQTSIDGAKRPGDGVFAALLRRRGASLGTE